MVQKSRGKLAGRRLTAASCFAIMTLAVWFAWLWIGDDQGSVRADLPESALLGEHAEVAGETDGGLAAAVVGAARPLPTSETKADTSYPALQWPAGVERACLTGRVVDLRGHPWPGATVVFVPDRLTTDALGDLPGGHPAAGADPLNGLPQTLSDSAGRFELCGPWLRAPGSRDPQLAITAPGMAWQGHAAAGFDGRSMDLGDLVLAQQASAGTLRVIDEHGEPLADVLATMSFLSGMSPADDDPEPPSRLAHGVVGRTDAKGRLLIDHRWPSKLGIMLSKQGYEQAMVTVRLESDEHTDQGDVVLTHGRAVSGTVLDENSDPVANAQVMALASGLSDYILSEASSEVDMTALLLKRALRSPLQSRSLADGSFVLGGLSVQIQELSLLGVAPGLQPGLMQAVVPGSEGLKLILRPEASLTVSVVSTLTGQEIPGSELSAVGRTGFAEDDEDAPFGGAFFALEIEGARVLNPGLLGSLLFATAPGHIARRVEVSPSAAGDQRQVAIELRPGANIGGRVVDALGQPVATAKIELWPAHAFQRLWDTQEQVSDAVGYFDFPLLQAGLWHGQVSKIGHATAPIAEIDSAEPGEELQLTLPRGGRVVGELFDAQGSPAVAAWVGAKLLADSDSGDDSPSANARTDRTGRFEFAGLIPGLWSVKAGAQTTTRVAVEAGETVEIQLRLLPVLRVRGRTHAGADDLPQVFVGATGTPAENGRQSITVSTRSTVGGDYSLELPEPGQYTFTFRSRSGPRLTRELVLNAGDDLLLDVDFGTGGLAGQVSLAIDGPTLDSWVSVRLSHDGEYAGSVGVDPEGRFSFTPLPAGPYTLHTQTDTSLPLSYGPVELAPGELRDDLQLVVQPGTHVLGMVRNPDGSFFEGFAHLRRTDGKQGYHVSPVESGEIDFNNIEPGGWRLDLASFFEEVLGQGEGLRGEPGVELPFFATRRFTAEPFATLKLDIEAQRSSDG